MSIEDDHEYYRQDKALADYVEDQFRMLAEGRPFSYLAHHGDAIEERVRCCLGEAKALGAAGFPGAAVARAAAGVEITIRFFLAHPLLQGAFLSDEWAQLLSGRILTGRTAEDRKLLPAILGNWQIDLGSIKVPSGEQLWDSILNRVWPTRNEYMHQGAKANADEARLAIECLETLLDGVVPALARRLGFTRDETGCWSVVNVPNPEDFPNLNPPRRYDRRTPFRSGVRSAQ
jgi:hypothetical protein